ncbi:hypothetical protein P154DRAFT_138851 [Amniculicola lignicola CBS 123094]|uniref:Acyl-CoA dehydrogenase/oxidase C-terminal n=1 Tax=Amniculicola lignicola CBS 123094 TaxID=1392246 RepID=A0A6A5WNU7_9PLEO|nr:hypothetical protein P154DRAFT_138851 [Amniculicola lignicola CBS 123094]
MANPSFRASSSTEGFFQTLPIVPPQFTNPANALLTQDSIHSSDDKVLARILALYLPPHVPHVTSHIHRVARIALDPSVLVHCVDAESNHPILRPLTTFGEENRTDPLWTTAGWKALKDIGIKEGVVAVAYENNNRSWNRRIHEFALGHLWTCTSTMTTCPMSMTDGAATLLSRHLGEDDGAQPGRKEVFGKAYARLTSRDPKVAWTSGQWMTERTGGSDVSGTETVARRLSSDELAQRGAKGDDKDAIGMPLGPWSINGFKWFSSATDSGMTVLLARTPKGLSAFYAPMRRRVITPNASLSGVENDQVQTELNGVRIQRLKNKLGTKSLPTAELELKGMRAWLIGIEGQGVKEISTILNITRLSTAAGSAGGWSRGLAICRAYSKVRKVRGALLQENPQHMKWMANETVKYWAAAHFAFIGVALQGAVEQDWDDMVKGTRAEALIPKDRREVMDLLRLLTPVMKAQVSVAAVQGLRECMECLGGVGYCENNEDGGLMNIAKVFRDNLVNPIWEGTVSVMAEDVVRVLIDKRLGRGDILNNLFVPWIQGILGSCKSFEEEVSIIKVHLKELKKLAQGASKDDLLYCGRELLERIEVIVCSTLLIYDASMHEDGIARAISRRWVRSKASQQPQKLGVSQRGEEALLDKLIFLGKGPLGKAKLERL